MTPADPTPVPPHLSDAERALWEKANALEAAADAYEAIAATASKDEHRAAYNALIAAQDALDRVSSPAALLSLLTALSSEREAGERDKTDAARYHRLRSIALGDDCDAWTAWYFLVDDVMPEGPAMFDKAVDAHTPEPAHD